ncbi:mechanosensitive ion channel [Flavobacterium amnicola]|uniref:Mechanosensitive ion channel n=1 Tax=Flavobacterium amnicola TaxID=2506422 RepID=A0A4Q1K5M2_9FLAO|nr:mechanosensitive ion channel domain-containing protein [Flavobacterium amnicola]RXR21216.1 mechanosensitive ion channel [Flavobacterium amnicola]
MENKEYYINTLKKFLFDYSANIITALIILFVGLWLSKFIAKSFKRILLSRNVELTLVEFLEDLVFWGIRGLVFISVISKLGVETSSFVAILGAAGLAVGLSLQGSLANFAGGILIVLFKPFKVGDKIEVQGEIGKVEDIQIFSTKILTGNNHMVYIPNGLLSNGKIKNLSQKHTSRTDFEIAITHEQNATEIKSKIEQSIKSSSIILKDPKPEIYISNYSETGITYLVRVWTENNDVTQAKSDILSAVK